jgi:hypothetical protein
VAIFRFVLQPGATSYAVAAMTLAIMAGLNVWTTGARPALPERRPSNDEIIASSEGQHQLAGYLLRNLADRVSVGNRNGHTTVAFHFDH